ncbi:MAG: lipoyl(octanoyl) transferase, partial [Verrucomicrobiota bacterium]
MTPVFAELHVYCDDTPRSAALNMAVDEALLEKASTPSLRIYRWDHPALSFGYFGRFADVVSCVGDRDVVRRWTGGGIVFHGEDLTYALVIPIDGRMTWNPIAIYTATHTAIADVLVA